MKAKLILVTLLLLVGAWGAEAQNLKIGYTNVDFILSRMPEIKQVDADLKSYRTVVQKTLQAKYAQYQALVAEYEANLSSYDAAAKSAKEKQITDYQQEIQKYQGQADSTYQKKEADLINPLYQKIGEAIQKVAEANGYDFILEALPRGLNVVLYGKEEHDVSPLVLEALGIKPEDE